MCDFDLWGAATGEQSLLFDQRADGAVRVVQRALRLVEDEVVGAAADNGYGVYDGLDAGHFDVAGA